MKLYFVKDVVNNDVITCVLGKNEKDAIRTLGFSGFFTCYRVEDCELYESGSVEEIEMVKGESIEVILEELNLHLESKAEPIADTVEEAKDKILEGGNNGWLVETDY